jgi:hypothetical protein
MSLSTLRVPAGQIYATISFAVISHMQHPTEHKVKRFKTSQTCKYYPVMDYAFAYNHQFFVEKYFPTAISCKGSQNTYSNMFVPCWNKKCNEVHDGIHQFVVKAGYFRDTNYLWFLSHEFEGLVPNYMLNFRLICYHVKHRVANIMKELARYHMAFCSEECMFSTRTDLEAAVSDRLTALVKTELWVPTFHLQHLWYGRLEPTEKRGPGVGIDFKWFPFSWTCEEKLPEL